MKLADMTLEAFSEVLASEAPAPGGGSTAALSGALGAGLIHMVCALTAGKKKYEEHTALVETTAAGAEAIRRELLEAVDRDTAAFDGVTAAFAMPKGDDAEIAARKQAIQDALKACVVPPLDVMKASLRALRLAEGILGKSNESALSDLGVAALSLQTALQGAWLNVLINIGGLGDKAFAEAKRAEAEGILNEAMTIADSMGAEIEARLMAQ